MENCLFKELEYWNFYVQINNSSCCRGFIPPGHLPVNKRENPLLPGFPFMNTSCQMKNFKMETSSSFSSLN